MGTRACTFFNSEDETDGIGLYTRWDGFEDEIKTNIKNLDLYWENYAKFLKDSLQHLTPEHPTFQTIQKYLGKIEKSLSLPNTVDVQASKLSRLSFNHHYVHHYNDDGWDVIAMQKDSKWIFNKKKAIDSTNKKLVPKAIPDEYSLIAAVDEDYPNEISYFKVKDFTRESIIKMVSDLPFFLAKLYSLSTLESNNRKNDVYDIYDSLNRTLSFFGNKKYNQLPYDDLNKYFIDVLDNASAVIPLNFAASKVYLHLHIQNPELILPLTEAERAYYNFSKEEVSKEAKALIYVQDPGRLNLLNVIFPKDEALTDDEFNNAHDYVDSCFKEFETFYGVKRPNIEMPEQDYSSSSVFKHFFDDSGVSAFSIHYEANIILLLFIQEYSEYLKSKKE